MRKLITICAVAGMMIMAISNAAQAATVDMEFVTIGDAGNTADDEVVSDGTTGYGGVAYEYNIGKHEVTEDQWFDYDSTAGGDGSDLPVVNVSWHEAAQFANWLTTGSAASGYYTISGGKASIPGQTHKEYADQYGTTYFIPTEDEWYKAAYYEGSDTYSDYANGTDDVPPEGLRDEDEGGPQAGWNYNATNDIGAQDVGFSPVEQNGTRDMMGNVWEWNEADTGKARGMGGGRMMNTPTCTCPRRSAAAPTRWTS